MGIERKGIGETIKEDIIGMAELPLCQPADPHARDEDMGGSQPPRGKKNKEPGPAKEHFKSEQKRRNNEEGVASLPTADPAIEFGQPELFGAARRGDRERETEILVLRPKVLLAISEKDNMRRIASSHSPMRYGYQDPTAHCMLRRPLASCEFGVWNQRNAKHVVRSHFREFREYGCTYNAETEAENGRGYETFPEIKDTSSVSYEPRAQGKKGGKNRTYSSAKGWQGRGSKNTRGSSGERASKQGKQQGNMCTFLQNAKNEIG